jgi:hypothetical protein
MPGQTVEAQPERQIGERAVFRIREFLAFLNPNPDPLLFLQNCRSVEELEFYSFDFYLTLQMMYGKCAYSK